MSILVLRHAGLRRGADPPASGGVWRRLVNNKIGKVEGMLADSKPVRPGELCYISKLLNQARQVAQAPGNMGTWWSGEQCDQAWRIVHEAEANAVALLPPGRRIARMQEVLFDAASILDPRDPVLQLKPSEGGEDKDASATSARELVQRYRQAWDDRYTRSRNYRNRLIILIAVVTLFVTVLVLVGALGLFSIHQQRATTGESQLFLVWPTWEPGVRHLIAMVAIGTIGAVGGLLAGARQVSEVGGVYNPFFLPLHSLILKIQMGALCGIAGTIAVLGGLAPEVKVGQWSDVVLWALVFGAAQQLVTQLVDRKVKALVSSEPRVQELKK